MNLQRGTESLNNLPLVIEPVGGWTGIWTEVWAPTGWVPTHHPEGPSHSLGYIMAVKYQVSFQGILHESSRRARTFALAFDYPKLLDQQCPKELSAMMEMICIWAVWYGSHYPLLSTWNLASATEEMYY